MKNLFYVLFSLISVLFLSGCSVIVDKNAGVVYTHSILGDMSHGYTERSGLAIQNPSPELRMEVTYYVCMRLNRSSELWGASQRSNPYPIAEVYRATIDGAMGQDVFIPAMELSNHKNILRVIVRFYDTGGYVDHDEREFYAYFYQGTWRQDWQPRPRA